MLAYVFWHWPSPEHSVAAYEHLQREFHTALAQSASKNGFLRSIVFRVDGRAPWLAGAPAYVDWHLVDDFAALDALNVAAVSGSCEQPHARVAEAMAAGAGSLLALRGQQADVATARHLTFVTKPRGMPYDAFYAATADIPAVAESTLWRRQMVLGPTPEFAILSPTRLTVPDTFQPLQLDLAPTT